MTATAWYDTVTTSPLSGLSSSAEDAVLHQVHANTSEPSLWRTVWVTAGLRVVLATTALAADDGAGLDRLGLSAEQQSALPQPFASLGETVTLDTDNTKEVLSLMAGLGVEAGKGGKGVAPHRVRSVDCSARSCPTTSEALTSASAPVAMTAAACVAAQLPSIALLIASGEGGRDACCLWLTPVVCDEKRDRRLAQIRYHGTVHRVLPHAERLCATPAGDACLVLSAVTFSDAHRPSLIGTALVRGVERLSDSPVAQPLYCVNPDALALLLRRRGRTLHWLYGTARPLAHTRTGTVITPCEFTLVEAGGYACHLAIATGDEDDATDGRRDPSVSTRPGLSLRLRSVCKMKQHAPPRPSVPVDGASQPYTQTAPSLSFEQRWGQSPWLAEAVREHAHRVQQRDLLEAALNVDAGHRRARSRASVVVLALSHDHRVALCRHACVGSDLFLAHWLSADSDSPDVRASTSAVAVVGLPSHLSHGAVLEDAVCVTSAGMQGFLCVFRRSPSDGVAWAFIALAGATPAVVVAPSASTVSRADCRKITHAAGRFFIASVTVPSAADLFGDGPAVRVQLGNTQCRDLVLRVSVSLPSVRAWVRQCYVAPLLRGDTPFSGAPHVAATQLCAWTLWTLLGTLPTPCADASDDKDHMLAPYAPLCAAAQFVHDVLSPLVAPLATMGCTDRGPLDGAVTQAALTCLAAVFQAVASSARLLQRLHGQRTAVPRTALAAPFHECVSLLVEALEVLVGLGATSALMTCLGPFMWPGSTAALALPLQSVSALREATVVGSWRDLWAPLFDTVYPLTLLTSSPLGPREVLVPLCSAEVREVDAHSHAWALAEAERRTVKAADGTVIPLLGWAAKEPTAQELLASLRRGDAADVRTLSLAQVRSTAQRLALEAGPSAAAEYLSYFTRHEGCQVSLVHEWQSFTALAQQTESLLQRV